MAIVPLEYHELARLLKEWRRSKEAEAKMESKGVDFSHFFHKAPELVAAGPQADTVMRPCLKWEDYSPMAAYIQDTLDKDQALLDKDPANLTQARTAALKKKHKGLGFEEAAKYYLLSEFKKEYLRMCFQHLGMKNLPTTPQKLYTAAHKGSIAKEAPGTLTGEAKRIADADFQGLKAVEKKKKYADYALFVNQSMDKYLKGVPEAELPRIDMHILDDGVLTNKFIVPTKEILSAKIRDKWKLITATESFVEDAVDYGYEKSRAKTAWKKSSVITKGQHYLNAWEKREFFRANNNAMLREKLFKEFHKGVEALKDAGLGSLFPKEEKLTTGSLHLRFSCLPPVLKVEYDKADFTEKFGLHRNTTRSGVQNYYESLFGENNNGGGGNEDGTAEE